MLVLTIVVGGFGNAAACRAYESGAQGGRCRGTDVWVPDFAPSSYADAARDVMESIERQFFDPATGGYFQALDKREPEFMWGNGVIFSALVAATRHEPEKYRARMERLFAAMDRHWDDKAPIPGYEPSPTRGNGHDKYYDDNEWMAITFAEAYELTGDAKYLERAGRALRFSLSGWDDQLGGGVWWHEGHKDGSKNTCANAPAAVACLRLARFVDREDHIDWARRLVAWTCAHLQDDDGLFFDNVRVADGRVAKFKMTYNTGLMIRANLGLFRATGDRRFLHEAVRIGRACAALADPKTGVYKNALRFSHLLVEADLELYRATADASYLERAKRNTDAALARWKASPPKELIEQASLARMLWLLGDQETQAGRDFWAKSDAPRLPPEPAEAISGDSVIRAPALGSEIVITTTSRLAGAIHSLTWNGKEFIDSADHGRQLQSASNLDCATPITAETFNPTEAGSRRDGAGPTSSGRLLALSASGRTLDTTNKMAFWLAPGETSEGNPAKNTTVLSDHLLRKHVRLGALGLEQLIRYDVTFVVPAGEHHTHAVFEALTGYMPWDFQKFWTLEADGTVAPIDAGPGEQTRPLIFSTEDGKFAMGIYSPDQPSAGFEHAGYGRWAFDGAKVVKWNCVFRVSEPAGIRAGEYMYRMYVAVGTLDDVRAALLRARTARGTN